MSNFFTAWSNHRPIKDKTVDYREELKSRNWQGRLLTRTKAFEFPWWSLLSFGALAGFIAADGLSRIIGKRAMGPAAIVLTSALLLTAIPSAIVGFTRFARWAARD